MNNTNTQDNTNKDDDMLPEYDFSQGTRGKHAKEYSQGHTVTITKSDATKSMRASLHMILPSWSHLLPFDWGWASLEDICIGIVDCPHSTPEVVESGPYLMARTPDILTGVFRADSARRVSEATYRDRTRRAEPRQGDLLYSREGTYFGLAAVVPPATKVCLGQRMVLLRPDPNRIDSRYLCYWLNSTLVQSYIHGHRDGSVAERLNLPTIRRLPVSIPPLPEQRAIASILGALDDKIELNRRMNRTLEEMARAVFQSWFVDFDPVRAKAEGRETGLPAEIAALFPDGFVESELEEIPEEWDYRPIGTLCDVNSWTLKASDQLSEIEYIEIAEVSRGDVNKTSIWARGDEPSRARRRLRHGDTALSTVRPERQAFFLCLDPSPTLIASTGFAVFTPKSAPWTYIHVGLTQPEVFQRLGHLADGGAYPAISPDLIGATPIAYPTSAALLDAFHELVSPAYLQMEANRKESRTLAALCDTLLPKLISGELRVPEAEELIEEAVA